jgi:hypothetical protein
MVVRPSHLYAYFQLDAYQVAVPLRHLVFERLCCDEAAHLYHGTAQLGAASSSGGYNNYMFIKEKL